MEPFRYHHLSVFVRLGDALLRPVCRYKVKRQSDSDGSCEPSTVILFSELVSRAALFSAEVDSFRPWRRSCFATDFALTVSYTIFLFLGELLPGKGSGN